MMRKVGFAIDDTFIGGGHRHVLMLVQGLQNAGGDPFVFVSGQGPFTEELTKRNVKWHVLPMGKKITPGAYFKWKRALRDFSADILHLHGGVAGFWGRWAASETRRYKIIWTLHGIHYPHHLNPLVRWISHKADRWLVKKMDLALCVSKADQAMAVQMGIVEPDKSRVVYNGIEVDYFASARRKKFAELDSKSIIRVGLVGRLCRMKGQTYALDAVSILKEKYPGLQLIFCGAGEDEALLRRQAVKLVIEEKITFAGFQKNMPEVFRRLDMNLMPSLWEGQPLTLLESFAAGVPTIASNLECVKEIVQDGKECLLVPPQDSKALAAAITKMIENPALKESLVAQGIARASRFETHAMVKNTLEIYEAVC